MTTDINELFDRDPLSFTKEGGEVASIIAYLRERRTQFNQGAKQAGSEKATPKVKEIKPLSLEQLFGSKT
jgi:hypothetical protein